MHTKRLLLPVFIVLAASAVHADEAYSELHFPEEHSIGQISVRDKDFGIEDSGWEEGRLFRHWRRLGPARGVVEIPSDQDVRLSIKSGVDDLAVLSTLPSDSVQFLQLRYIDVDDEDLRHISHLSGMKALWLTRTAVTDTGLAQIRDLTSLVFLELSEHDMTDIGLEYLAGLTRLRKLILTNTGFGDTGMRHLRSLTSLRELRLHGTKVTEKGLAELTVLQSLEYLGLPGGVTNDGLKHVATLGSLRELHFVEDNFVTDEGLAYLMELPHLETLNLANLRITDSGMAHVAKIKTLKDLWIQLCPITDRGLAVVGKMGSLERVHLSGIEMTADGLGHLSKLPNLHDLYIMERRDQRLDLEHLSKFSSLRKLEIDTRNPRNADPSFLNAMPHLESLRLSGIPISDRDLAHITKLTSLEQLVLNDTKITDHGLEHLENLKSLRYLYLGTRTVSEDAVAALRSKLPHLDRIDLPRVRAQKPTPEVGQQAFDIEVELLDGKSWRLRDQRGKVVFIYFWATWCSPCVSSTPKLKRSYDELRDLYGDTFVMISLSLDEQDDVVGRHVSQYGLNWPQARVGLDSQICREYGIQSVPNYIAVGSDGNIVSTGNWPEVRKSISAISSSSQGDR